jgi:solute carrier family 25 carnitine/acylcarnitine transporter 20/29
MMDNFVYGSMGGLLGTFVSHPFDTVKTRLQTKTAQTFMGAIKMGKLYGGVRAPAIGIPLEKSIVFGFYSLAKEHQINNFYSGLIGGLMCTIIVTPVEYFKINSQNKNKINIATLRLSNIYKGFIPTICRETPGFGIYFATYNHLTDKYNKEKNVVKVFCFGGISGLAAWVFIYPADLIKTIVQDKNNTKSITEVIKHIYKTNGLPGFYNGFRYAALRAVPLHAGVFAGVEISKKIHNYISTFA